MRRKIPAILLLLLLLPAVLAGCMRENNDFVYDLDGAPQNLDPQSAADPASRLVIANIFEGLVTVGADGGIRAGAAESWTVSKDGLTYEFTLREDGKWSNGDPVTAEDFVYGFRRLFDPATNAPGVSDFLCIRGGTAVLAGEADGGAFGVRASGKRTLVIELERYNSRFLELLATAPAMPCKEDFFLSTKGKYGLAGNKIMGNGAFYLSSWGESGTVRLRPSATYYDRSKVTATSLTLAAPSSGTALERFRSGTSSAVALGGAEFLSLGDLSGQEVERSDSAVWGMIFQVEAEPFSNEKIRQALFLDADFSTMEAVLPEYYQRARAVVSKNAVLDGENYREAAGEDRMPALDREGAKELFRAGEAELSTDGLTGVRLILPAGYGHEQYFAYLSQIWQRDFGLYLIVETLDAGNYAARLAAGDYECALVSLSGSGGTPEAALSYFASEGGGYHIGELDRLLTQAAGESDGETALELYRQAEDLLIGQGRFLPFYYQAEYFVCGPGITGVTYRFDSRTPDFRFGKIR